MTRYKTKPKVKRWPKRVIIIAASLLAVIIAATIISRQVYFAQLQPVDRTNHITQTVTIVPGSTVEEIATQLEQAGLIRSAWAFKLYVSSKEARNDLQAGEYALYPGLTVAEIVAILTHGKVTTDLVTILPGQRLQQIRDALVAYGFSEGEVDAALDPEVYASHPALVDKPAGASLEGYLYPESFQKTSTTSVQSIIRLSLDEMAQALSPDIRAGIAAQGLSVYQGIILASIIEREVSDKNADDRPQAAQVFLKRLGIGMRLESNATDNYPAEYDTYNIPGLPPTPISNVSSSSLHAVAHPASTNWLFFVSGKDCVTRFSSTVTEHEALKLQHGIARPDDQCT